MTVTTFAHHHDVPAAAWRWPHFSPAEIACRGTGHLRIDEAGDDPAQYVDVAFKVPARKCAAWPAAIRAGFEPARTVRPGALKIESVPQGADR